MIERFSDLSIKKYRELVSIERDGEDDTEYGVRILSILSDMTEDELLDMPLNDFTTLMAKSKFVFSTFQRKDFKDLGKRIKVNGKEYKFIRSAKDLTAGQYIDYKTYMSRDNFLEMLPYVLTVFLIPDGKRYATDYDIAELASEFDENIDIATALAISDFFLHQSKVLMLSSITSLRLQMKRMMRREKNQEMKDKIAECLAQMESLQGLIRVSDGFTQQ